MSAEQFWEVSTGKTAAVAYRKAVRQAEYDCGHDAYNGTISTTDGFKMVSIKDAQDPFAYAEEHGCDFDKRGECGCIELKKDKLRQCAATDNIRATLDNWPKRQRVFLFFGLAAT